MNQADDVFLRQAIRLAMTARGRVEPNPMVGCVLVKDNRVIGQGCHSQFGGPHAEPFALTAASESTQGATAYVTLEPCCHTNKKTPPCAPRLIEARLARVVVGCVDPNPEVNGRGLAMLRGAGIDVEIATGALAAESRQLIAPFMAVTRFARPYITLKWAQSADGKVAGAGGTPLAISNSLATQQVHQLRAACDAILVGINTVLSDDPMLTARGVEGARPLRRIVLDSRLRIPLTSGLVRSAAEGGLEVFFTPTGFSDADPDKIKQLLSAGVELRSADELDRRICLPKLFSTGKFTGLTHLLVEPGPTLARAFFDAGAADRLWVIQSPRRVDSVDAPDAPAIPKRFVRTAEVDLQGDRISEYLDTESDVYFAPVPSADWFPLRET